MWRAAEGRCEEWREVAVDNGGKSLRRMEESFVAENFSLLRFQTRVGGNEGTKGGKGDE